MGLFGSSPGKAQAKADLRKAEARLRRVSDADNRAWKARGGKNGRAPESGRYHAANNAVHKALRAYRNAK